MLTLQEFKNRYKTELTDMSETEVVSYYNIYKEDPLEFHSSMIG
jgi:hypothetical protein